MEKGMPAQKISILELKNNGLEFALLRHPESWNLAADIDILVKNKEHAGVFLQKNGFFNYASDTSHSWYLKYDSDSKCWIHLDVQDTIEFSGYKAPESFVSSLLDKSLQKTGEIPRLDKINEAILIFLHSFLDKRKLDKRYRRIILGIEKDASMQQTILYTFLPKPLSYYLDIIDQLKNAGIGEEEATKLINKTFNAPLHIMNNNLARRIFRRIRRILSGPRPLVFLGPDGAGKSTNIDPLSKLPFMPTRIQYMGPVRESEMRIILLKTIKLVEPLRSVYSKKHPVGIVARGIWQIACYIDFLDRLFKHLYFSSGNGIVIFDRYPCDMFFRKPSRWNEFLFIKLFPKPKLVLLFVGDAKMIHLRKPELMPDEIEKTIKLYRTKLAQYSIPFHEIDTTENNKADALKETFLTILENKSLFV